MNIQDVQRQFNMNHGAYSINMFVQIMWLKKIAWRLDYMIERNKSVENSWDCFQKFLEENPDWTIESMEFDTKEEKSKDNYEAIVCKEREAVIRFEGEPYNTSITISSKSQQQCEELYDLVAKYFPERKKKEPEQSLKIDFWYMANEPNSITRSIEVPNWDEVRNNYTSTVQDEVDKLIKMNRPKSASKLLILNGMPGCGKTYLLRTLLWEWRDWAKADFVLDPETLFSSPAYLLKLILDTEENDDEDMFGRITPVKKDEKKWRILILEDADQYISQSAKVEYNQQVARLLNLLDGLIGQGMNLMVILTANEEQHKIHNAISRPGRCLSNISFDGFTREEAVAWLVGRGLDESYLPSAKGGSVGFRNAPSKEHYSLAELYQIVKDNEPEPEPVSQDATVVVSPDMITPCVEPTKTKKRVKNAS